MSKSKSKSKSKQATFPDQYWKPEFETYTYYPNLFAHGRELLDGNFVQPPPERGDVIERETDALLKKQDELNGELNKRQQRTQEIEWESEHLSRNYQKALLAGPDTYPMTWQLMNTMSDLALIPVMHFKKKFGRARPNQVEPRIEPLIEVPGHPSYPSGHSTQNFLIAHVLSEVIGDDAELIGRVFAIARRVAENREWAGVHYHSDTQAGERLAREIFPTMRRAFKELIEKAIKEWQELELEREEKAAQQVYPAMYQLQDAPAKWQNPFSSSLFESDQWNLKNTGHATGKRGVDINVEGAWKKLGIWQGGAAPKKPVRVALIDLAIDFKHPALKQRFDGEGAVNLDYPRLSKRDRAKYVEGFRSFSSAHAIACAGIIAADRPELVWKSQDGSPGTTERGCLGIAPHSVIVPFRAMTLAEPERHKRQILARAVLQVATGRAFVEHGQAAQNGTGVRWKLDKQAGSPADVLLFPLPLEPLPEGCPDPLPLALAFAAATIPVIIPSGNRGTSSLSYPSRHLRELQPPKKIEELAKLFDLDSASVREIISLVEQRRSSKKSPQDQTSPKKTNDEIVEDLVSAGKDAVIWVGACNDQGERSRYSQYGIDLTVVAPSDDVLPPQHDPDKPAPHQSIATTDLKGVGGYMQDESNYTLANNKFGFGGTSAAAAQVAGMVALMLQANGSLGPAEVREILCKTARKDLLVADRGSGANEFGSGLIDATAAVEEAALRRPSPPKAAA